MMDAADGKMWIAPRPYKSSTFTEYNFTD